MIRSLHTLHSHDNPLGGAVHAGQNVCKYLVETSQFVEVFATHGAQEELDYPEGAYQKVPCNFVRRKGSDKVLQRRCSSGLIVCPIATFRLGRDSCGILFRYNPSRSSLPAILEALFIASTWIT